MNEQRAREIVRFAEEQSYPPGSYDELRIAEGYLQALEDERAKAKVLVDMLESVRADLKNELEHGGQIPTDLEAIEKTLSLYKKGQGE